MLENQKILLIGGSGTIGLALCRELVKNRADLRATCNKNPEPLEEFKKSLPPGKSSLFDYTRVDILSPESCESLSSYLSDSYFIPDTIIFNAGITADCPFLAMDDKSWNTVINTNLTGAFNVLRACIKLMYSGPGGKILIVSSAAGTKGGRGQANYAASKAGLEAMSRSLAHELARKNITVNCIAPGIIQSSMTQELMKRAEKKVLENILLGRPGLPEEAAKFVSHLCSPDISYITGQTFHIDGGLKL
jgi:3-oxoacyl-[acyl-carrier protein] reductase